MAPPSDGLGARLADLRGKFRQAAGVLLRILNGARAKLEGGARLSAAGASARTAAMMCSDRPPVIGIPVCYVQGEGFGHHQVAAKYVDGVVDGAGGLPLLIPALGPRLDLAALLERLDGLMITGARRMSSHTTTAGRRPRRTARGTPIAMPRPCH